MYLYIMSTTLNICLGLVLVLMIILMYSFTFETNLSKMVRNSIFTPMQDTVNSSHDNGKELILDQSQFIDKSDRFDTRGKRITHPDIWLTTPYNYKNYASIEDYDKYFVNMSYDDHSENLRINLKNINQGTTPDHELKTE